MGEAAPQPPQPVLVEASEHPLQPTAPKKEAPKEKREEPRKDKDEDLDPLSLHVREEAAPMRSRSVLSPALVQAVPLQAVAVDSSEPVWEARKAAILTRVRPRPAPCRSRASSRRARRSPCPRSCRAWPSWRRPWTA